MVAEGHARRSTRSFVRVDDLHEIRGQLDLVGVAAAWRVVVVMTQGLDGRTTAACRLEARQLHFLEGAVRVVGVADRAAAAGGAGLAGPPVGERLDETLFGLGRAVRDFRGAIDRIGHAGEPAVLVVVVEDDVPLAGRLEELVGRLDDASELVEVGDAPLLIDECPSLLGVDELEEDAFASRVAGGARGEEPHLTGAVAVLDVTGRQRAEAGEDARVPAVAEHLRRANRVRRNGGEAGEDAVAVTEVFVAGRPE